MGVEGGEMVVDGSQDEDAESGRARNSICIYTGVHHDGEGDTHTHENRERAEGGGKGNRNLVRCHTKMETQQEKGVTV